MLGRDCSATSGLVLVNVCLQLKPSGVLPSEAGVCPSAPATLRARPPPDTPLLLGLVTAYSAHSPYASPILLLNQHPAGFPLPTPRRHPTVRQAAGTNARLVSDERTRPLRHRPAGVALSVPCGGGSGVQPDKPAAPPLPPCPGADSTPSAAVKLHSIARWEPHRPILVTGVSDCGKQSPPPGQ